MSLTVCVDGGGSGCRLGAFDNNGHLLAKTEDGPASLSLGEEQAWARINRGISSLANRLGKPTDWLPDRLFMGLAGSLQQSRRTHFLSLVPQSISAVLITDGHAQLLGAADGQAGACLSVGTGSVLHWLDASGNFNMAGGWGYPLGDEASGAWLGAQLINAYLWHLDSRQLAEKSSTLFHALEERIGHDASDVQVWSTSKQSTQLASLAPMIISAAEKDDALANTLLERGTEQCERLLSLAPSNLPIYIVGGLAEIYRPRFQPNISARIEAPKGDALSGLYAYSKIHPSNL